MKQSELNFKENTKSCVWCDWDGNIEFYWEARSNYIVITPDKYQNIYVPDNATPSLIRKEICQWLEASFNV
ncbi:hypothetical protein [Shewanella sp. SM71]|uniref:hypothetical protein n=1 Tax=Shewanella sp. SM71 TaxID=2912804 RepID=UPI0021D7D481|nr:hypothetical protein [Shewanella sp. SM71]MCU8036851.1 hypothetical protein [Shewanella sp. SM71]